MTVFIKYKNRDPAEKIAFSIKTVHVIKKRKKC